MGNCSLAEYAYEYGVTGEIYKGEHRNLPIDESNPFIYGILINVSSCGKCIKACSEIQGKSILDFSFRGFDTQVGPAFNVPYNESDL